MTKLYEVANDYARLLESDLPPEDIADTVEGIEGELTDKIEQLLSICKNELVYANALKEESRALSERAKVSESKISSIKAYIATSLTTVGKKTIRAGIHQVTVRAPSKSVDIIDANLLPTEFVEYETKIKPDTMAIKHLLESGKDIPGAKIKTGKPSLIIK
ncbi:siphovirus Gp157 family protein [Jejubacter calystegiae]|uniref:Siphovirus Gp157 family protein n=1 Tax=Jejubacter calystegiae TaxID=2579935 RepID=A0A4P8YPA3_9ENTR|nr:siphovirus Gp157 family protein [Jejubacter calystegiae]QCT21808.1 siphovirus Gp157 family protein [Jejubacter calystegiae]